MSATTSESASLRKDNAADLDTAGGLSHRQIMTILSGLLLGMFLAALDQTIVSTAIRTIGDDLNGLSAQAWVTTAFLIASTISTPLFGKLSDLYGRKPFFMLAIVIFIVGSALCGLAQSMYELAGFRAFQGIGAGGIMPLALAIIGDIIPPRQRAKYQGYFMAVFATSTVLGPLIGGFLAGQSDIFGVHGWRWIFYINVPIGIFALFVITKVLKLDHNRREHRIDWAGAGALAVTLVPLLIVAEQGRTWGFLSVNAIICYLLGVVGLVSFVFIERAMGDEALLPLRMFRNSVFRVGSAQSLLIGMGMFGGISSIPLYLQIVKGASPTKAGLLTLPLVAALMVSGIVSGQFTARTGRYKILPVTGSILLVIGLFLMTRIAADTPLWEADLYMVVFGLGIGLNMQSIVLAMQNAVEPRDMGVATSSTTFFRQVGGSLGTAIFLSILFAQAGSNIGREYAKAKANGSFDAAAKAHPADAASLQQHLGGSGGLNDTAFLQKIDHALAHPFLVGFSDAMDRVFLVGAIVMVLAAITAFLLKEVPLRNVSGQQARAAAEQAANAGAQDASSQRVPAEPRGDEPTPQGAATSAAPGAVTSTAPVIDASPAENGRHESTGVAMHPDHDGRHEATEPR